MNLREFYSKRFIPQMPPDTEMTPVSRTIGEDQIVDEMVFKFTHTIPDGLDIAGYSSHGKARGGSASRNRSSQRQANWLTNTFTGTRHRCLFRSDYSILLSCP